MKRLVYFIPSVIGLGFYSVVALSGKGTIYPVAWVLVALLFVSGVFLCLNQWWGSIFGLLVGAVGIYLGTRDTGQIINEIAIGIIICAFYIISGIYIYRKQASYRGE